MKSKLLPLLGLVLLSSSAFAVQTLTYNFTEVTHGSTSPSGPTPWLSITATEIGNDALLFTVTSRLVTPEFISGIGLNLKDTTATFNTYSSIGGFVAPTIAIGPSIDNGGGGIRYDLWFAFDTNNSNPLTRFNDNDSFSYVVNGLSINDFESPVTAHVQSLTGGESAWISGTGITTINQLPEPSCALLGGLGLLTLFRRRRG